MSWSASNADFNIHLFLEHLRVTKPPYYCPYGECEGKVYKSFQGMQTHIGKQHPEAMEAPAKPKAQEAASGTASSLSQRGLPWDMTQKVVEVDCGGTLWRLNITEPLSVHSQTDADLPHDEKAAAVEAAYKSALSVSEDIPKAEYRELKQWAPIDSPTSPLTSAYLTHVERSPSELDGEVEYDMDEEDYAWLAALNKGKKDKDALAEPTFELLMDRLEKESHWETNRGKEGRGGGAAAAVDEDAVCCVCQDGEAANANAILFCDMCNLAVHQECYGIPYVPEGQWLCRRCQLSPSAAVQCSLCPNKGGAFKQTSEGNWVHVICAIWVPEVHFANTVFLEPVEGLDTVPSARWKLKCIVCKQRGVGACIQCNKPSCYTPFHVTCAQSAGVYMKVEPVSATSPGGTPYGVRKFIYCDIHAPAPLSPRKDAGVSMSRGADLSRTPGAEELAARRTISAQKMRKARKLLAASRSSAPSIALPVISLSTLEDIANLIPSPSAAELIGAVYAYWRLKRESRFGVPLLRRLQSQKSKLVAAGGGDKEGGDGGEVADPEERREIRRVLRAWRGLRQDLERVRLLCELLRKREKLKLEHVSLAEELVERLWRPQGRAFVDAVEKMMEKDRFKVFAQAVSEEDVPGYRSIIPQPMDLGTMHNKATSGAYKSWADVHEDFKLMIDNCTKFNRNNATFFKYGLRMKRLGMQVMKGARESAGTSSLSAKDKEAGLESLSALPLALPQGDELPSPATSPPSAKEAKREAKEAPKDEPPAKKRKRGAAATPGPSARQASIKDFVKVTPKAPSFAAFRAGPSAVKSPEGVSSAASSEEDADLPRGVRRAQEKAAAAHQSPSQEEEEEGSEYGYLLEHPKPLDMVWAPFVLPPAPGSRRGTRAWLPAIVIDPNMPKEGITVEGMELEAPPAAIKARDPNTDIQDEHEIRVLVRFFEPGLSWEWVAFIELFHFVADERIDNGRLEEPKKAADRASVAHAYDRAKLFWCKLHGEKVPQDLTQRLSPGKHNRCSIS